MKNPSRDPSQWFAKGDADLRAAEMVIADAGLADIACYHAQQCAEKYLKGYLISRNIEFKFVHELAYLVSLCLGMDPGFSSMVDPAAELQDYATGVRYPTDELQPLTLQEAKEALDRAKALRAFVLTRMG